MKVTKKFHLALIVICISLGTRFSILLPVGYFEFNYSSWRALARNSVE